MAKFLHGPVIILTQNPEPKTQNPMLKIRNLSAYYGSVRALSGVTIPFRRDYLLKFNALTPTPLEQIESVDMLRILEHGDRVHMVMTEAHTVSVDTPADLERARSLLQEDKLLAAYLSKPDDQTSIEGK